MTEAAIKAKALPRSNVLNSGLRASLILCEKCLQCVHICFFRCSPHASCSNPAHGEGTWASSNPWLCLLINVLWGYQCLLVMEWPGPWKFLITRVPSRNRRKRLGIQNSDRWASSNGVGSLWECCAGSQTGPTGSGPEISYTCLESVWIRKSDDPIWGLLGSQFIFLIFRPP